MSIIAPNRRSRARRSRRGVSVLWLIVFLPLALIGLLMTIETGRLWLARAEVEDALEAAALAAVIEWGHHHHHHGPHPHPHPPQNPHADHHGPNSTLAARQVAADFAASNTVLGSAFSLHDPSLNHHSNGNGNQNASSGGVLVFGAITQVQPTVIFDPNADPHNPNYFYAVLARSAYPVASEFSFGGFTLGPYAIQAETVAMIDDDGRARIVRIDSIASP
ncbi:pilus assembly protein TadG-related protein [Blastopirellula sp. JC732]|uniref:Pilus assembly protein TadG-related protein n=1 Tax=Blastopirellula sediminis TaxID=2894196 RepID=A0A9X1MRT3_9BACT|nr:pilus assembly protein TadG-related protein [Blastopirellula sediminis]MCC9605440.1 pilus assembly protein TadG-related protein [Blastopirellula sediminis]MCC9631260.1 pilus assembly protein TadG-related protein [Blastopirellula sediminis]